MLTLYLTHLSFPIPFISLSLTHTHNLLNYKPLLSNYPNHPQTPISIDLHLFHSLLPLPLITTLLTLSLSFNPLFLHLPLTPTPIYHAIS